ncbi:MAG: GNAT family N-acetyltransferase, partial [Actinomycetes bacterium]
PVRSSGRVRDAVVDDARAIAEIKVAGWRAAYRGLLPDSALDALDVEELTVDWARQIAVLQEPSGCLVVESDQVVLGYGVFGRYRWPELSQAGEVYAFYVDPTAWGRGLGRTLMTAVEARLEAAGFVDLALWVLQTNQAGRRFYEALGWASDETVGDRCEVDRAPEIRYRKTVGR